MRERPKFRLRVRPGNVAELVLTTVNPIAKKRKEERFAGKKAEVNRHKFLITKDDKGVEVEIPIDLPSLG